MINLEDIEVVYKEVCEICGNFFSDPLNHILCENLKLGHKCRIHFDEDGNRIKEK